jgi:decaprenyl-phosphate phosphoribosyltransferase
MKFFFRLIRPTQWLKNIFVVSPLLVTPDKLEPINVLTNIAGVICFCVIASSTYVFNDLIDRENDKFHPIKKIRPLPAGDISVGAAAVLALVLFIFGIAGSFMLDMRFGYWVLGYVGLSVAYSILFKHHSPIDVLVIAVGFVIRVEAGSVLVNVTPTVWILICTTLLALFLALAKRRDDLIKGLDEAHRPSLTGYSKPFLDVSISMILGALLVSYIIYTTDVGVMERMKTDKLYLTVPFVILGILRYLQLTLVYERSGSPATVIITDRIMVIAISLWVLVFGAMIYT